MILILGNSTRPVRTGLSRKTELQPGTQPLNHCTHLCTEASGPGCLDSPSPVNWSWCWYGYSGCWVAGQAWSCHSCSGRSEMADSGWAGVRNASEERETAVGSTHPLTCTREEVPWCRWWSSRHYQLSGEELEKEPLLHGFSCAGGQLMQGGGLASTPLACVCHLFSCSQIHLKSVKEEIHLDVLQGPFFLWNPIIQ